MDEEIKFDYYYGIEADQFSFFRIPRLLMKDTRFKKLSSDAKLLYGLMLDRMSLSMKNGWIDGENRAYIYYTLENIMDELGCAKATCVKVISELDSKKGIGLIEKKRQGLGKPDIIYVKNFATLEEKTAANTNVSTEVQNLNFKKSKNENSRGSEIELQEVQNLDFKEFRNDTSGSIEIETPEVQELDPNYTNTNYTECNNINPIYPSKNQGAEIQEDGMDETTAYMEMIKENIEYEHYVKNNDWGSRALYQELYDVICEVICVPRKTIKVAGEEYPYALVKSKFLKLNSSHLEYVIGCMQDTTSKINNIKAYMVTALFNAPSTMNHFYQQEVAHDMYGGGWHEKDII